MKLENPLALDSLTNIFRTSPKNPMQIVNRESATIEFKESFGFGNMAQYFKTMASFANNIGGYIIFGVGDKPRRLLGLKKKSLEQFESFKVEEFTKHLLDYFSPEIEWDHCTFEFKNMCFGVIYTYPLEHKPCICKKVYDCKNNKYSLKEGDIYYRYGGRSERIHFPELTKIIDEARRLEENRWIDLIKKVAYIGIDKACLLDLNTGVISGKQNIIYLDKNLVSQINFLKTGEFVEKKGKPALRLIGDVKQIASGPIIARTEKRIVVAIETADVVKAFLLDSDIERPVEYIRVLSSANSANYPIYYFIEKGQLKISEAIEIIKNCVSRGNIKNKIIERLEGKLILQATLSDKKTPASNKKRLYHQKWIDNSIQDDLGEDVEKCMDAFLTLSDIELVKNNKYIKKKLLSIYNKYYENATSILATKIRKGISRLDEVLYRKQANN